MRGWKQQGTIIVLIFAVFVFIGANDCRSPWSGNRGTGPMQTLENDGDDYDEYDYVTCFWAFQESKDACENDTYHEWGIDAENDFKGDELDCYEHAKWSTRYDQDSFYDVMEWHTLCCWELVMCDYEEEEGCGIPDWWGWDISVDLEERKKDCPNPCW